VVERVDGGAITEHDRQHLGDVVAALGSSRAAA
jgi:hypothetical protein